MHNALAVCSERSSLASTHQKPVLCPNPSTNCTVMSRKTNSSNQQKPPPKKKRVKGRSHTLSARAQAVLSTVLEDVIEKTLEDARKMAETAGKGRVSLEEVEEALKKLCERFHPRAAKAANEIIEKGRGRSSRK